MQSSRRLRLAKNGNKRAGRQRRRREEPPTRRGNPRSGCWAQRRPAPPPAPPRPPPRACRRRRAALPLVTGGDARERPGLPGPGGGREGRGPGARLMKPGSGARPPSTLHSVGAGRCEPPVNCRAGREARQHPLTAAPAPAPFAPRLCPSCGPSSRACLSPSADRPASCHRPPARPPPR